MGMNAAMDQREIAKLLARLFQSTSSSQQQSLIQNFYPGVSLQQVHSVVAENSEQMMRDFMDILGA